MPPMTSSFGLDDDNGFAGIGVPDDLRGGDISERRRVGYSRCCRHTGQVVGVDVVNHRAVRELRDEAAIITHW